MLAVKAISKQAKELKEFKDKQLDKFNKRLAPFENKKMFTSTHVKPLKFSELIQEQCKNGAN